MFFLFLFTKEGGGDIYDCQIICPNKFKEVQMKKFFFKIILALTNKRGDGYVDTAVKLIISVVIGALLLGGWFSLFNGVVLPGLVDRIQGMFN